MQRLARIDPKLALWSSAIFLVLMAVFVPSFALRQKEEQDTRTLRDRFATAQVAERFLQLVSMRVKTLELLEYLPGSRGPGDDMVVWSSRIEQKIQGFFAINWVDPRGVITSVVPEPRNVKALGRNLLERAETRPYLLLARDEHRPAMSHVIELYQGPTGMVIYLPIYEGGEFKGWINGVFTAEDLVNSLLLKGEFESNYLSLRIPDHPERSISYGALRPGQRPVPHVFTVLNQTVEIQIAASGEALADSKSLGWTWLIFVLVTLCSFVLSVCAYMLMLSRQRLAQRLEKERLHGVLLNLLVHDIINPLMIVRFGGETAQRLATPELKGPIEKVLYGVAQINDVISRVKDLRAVEAGRFVPKVEPVLVNEVIDEATRLFDQRIRAKEITGVFSRATGDDRILIDRVIFQNNVLNNLMSNAIKFSGAGGLVSLKYLGREGRFGVIEVRDRGVGMSEDIRANLFLDNVDVSRPGTLGEKGTGIGMMQVKTYMKLFGGHVSVESRAKTAGEAAPGTSFRLYLPLAT